MPPENNIADPPVVPEWLATQPDEIKNDVHVQKYKSFDEYYKAEKNQRELLGKTGRVVVPTDASKPEEWDEFYTKTGRPKEPKEYKISTPENLHKALQITPEFNEKFNQTVFQLGLSQKQADQLYKTYLADASLSFQAREEAAVKNRQDAEIKLKNLWGADYERNLALAGKVAKGFGGGELYQVLGDAGNHPAILATFARIGSLISEDRIPNLQGGGGAPANASKDAQAKISAAMNDPAHPYRDAGHKDHIKAVEEVTALYKIAYPK